MSKTMSQWQKYVKNNFDRVKSQTKVEKNTDIMKILAKEYKELGLKETKSSKKSSTKTKTQKEIVQDKKFKQPKSKNKKEEPDPIKKKGKPAYEVRSKIKKVKSSSNDSKIEKLENKVREYEIKLNEIKDARQKFKGDELVEEMVEIIGEPKKIKKDKKRINKEQDDCIISRRKQFTIYLNGEKYNVSKSKIDRKIFIDKELLNKFNEAQGYYFLKNGKKKEVRVFYGLPKGCDEFIYFFVGKDAKNQNKGTYIQRNSLLEISEKPKKVVEEKYEPTPEQVIRVEDEEIEELNEELRQLGYNLPILGEPTEEDLYEMSTISEYSSDYDDDDFSF